MRSLDEDCRARINELTSVVHTASGKTVTDEAAHVYGDCTEAAHDAWLWLLGYCRSFPLCTTVDTSVNITPCVGIYRI